MRVLALVVLLIGCPRDVTEPERPPGTPCTQNSDCTPVGAPCGQIWVCADGYWCDLTKNLCPGTLTPDYDALLDTLLAIYDEAVDYAVDGADLAGLDRLIRDRIREAGYPGQPSHPVCHAVGARAHEPPYAH